MQPAQLNAQFEACWEGEANVGWGKESRLRSFSHGLRLRNNCGRLQRFWRDMLSGHLGRPAVPPRLAQHPLCSLVYVQQQERHQPLQQPLLLVPCTHATLESFHELSHSCVTDDVWQCSYLRGT